MKNTLLVSLLFLVFITISFSQNVSLNTLTSAGDFARNKQGVSLSWTIGEVFSQTVEETHHVTGGFQQGAMGRSSQITLTANRQNESEVLLEWQVSGHRKYSGGFNIQRRMEGTAGFQTIAFVESEINTGRRQAIDANPSNETTYYRIEYFDKKSAFTNVETVEGLPESAVITLFPNPAIREINIRLESGDYENLSVQIFDQTGRVMLSRDRFPGNGPTLQLAEAEHLQPGVYTVRINKNGALLGSKQFIKSM